MPTLAIRLIYGAGGAVYAVKEAAYTMFILLFYTQVLGLNGTLTGVIIAIGLLWDAVSDPLVGALSDRLASPYGRRHPFMVASIIPLGLGFIGLFSPPESLLGSDVALAAWLLFWSLWVRTFVTTFSIPSLAMCTDISSDYYGRSQILGARMSALFLFSVLVPAFALVFIFQTDGALDGRLVRDNYPRYGLLSCAVCWVMGSIATFGTQRYAKSSGKQWAISGSNLKLTELIGDLLRTLSNRSFALVLSYDIAIMVSFGVISALNMLLWTYVWGFSTQEISIILSLPSLLAIGLVLLSLGPLSRRFEKYELLQLSAVGLILNVLWLYPLKIFGLLPDDQHTLAFVLNLLSMLLFMYCFLMRGIQTQSIIADVTDEHEWEHGLRQEGGFFSASNFAMKMATIVGPLYGGIVVDVVGLKAGMLPGSVAKPILDGLLIAFGLGVVPGLLIALCFALRIDLTRAKVTDLQRKLSARSEAARL